jgi:protein ImuA
MSSVQGTKLSALREQIEGMEGVLARSRSVLPFGVPEIDNKLIGGGLARGALHEIAGGSNGAIHGAAAISFAAGIAARANGPVLWCYTQPDLFAPALAASGLSEDRVVFFEAGNEKALLSCVEDALKHGSVAAVVGEVANISHVQSLRLQYAAESTQTLALLVRRWRRHVDARDFGRDTAAFTRWRVTEVNSVPLPVRGIGRPRWMLELMRTRTGQSADFEIEACDDKGFVAVPANMADRSATSGVWQLRAAQ